MSHSILLQVGLVIVSTVLLGVAIWLLSIYKRLFTGIRNIWLRRNLAVLSIAGITAIACIGLMVPGILSGMKDKEHQKLVSILSKEFLQLMIIVMFVFNTVWLVGNKTTVKNMSFIKHHAIIVLVIVVSTIFINVLIKYIDNGLKLPKQKELHAGMIFSYFNALITAFIYTAINYVELDRRRKLNEKELEVTRLMALKTKAELDALHSKVNPHFLYNALNSIADLSITDGRKARKMTIALADLFRYSINYSQNNYSTVRDEVAMTEVYLQIEKIRFEDQLNYTVNVDDDAAHFLIPRFILQPIAENAVKHGLKATGKMTEIILEVKKQDDQLEIVLADNGPAFPAELMPGYGVKSVFDKLDMLFPGQSEVHFSNEPRKQVTIKIKKLMKNEPAV